ncbi:PREDICTED: probable [Prunus dulcis]|uniref:PREDICTED: probable n=1 Tax=Prunus dulcis TaxID=3755 RepID=A0A5E4GJ77_PRUDU|nr:uncharacterized protein LOC117627704 [Prunus dulcis]VVA39869.1 PREDICTED: probable [Prunus dulcis]
MALALVGGAAIGALFGALYDVVKESMGRTVLQYKPLLGDLKFTLESLRPRIVQQIRDHNVELGLPNDDIESLQRQMEDGIVLVRKLSNIGMWNCYAWGSCCNCTKPSYSDQLVDLDRSLRILLEILKLQEARDVKEVLLLTRKIDDKQDELERRMSDLLKVQQEAGDVRGSSGSNIGTTVQQGNEGNGGHQVAPVCGVGGAATLGAVFGVLFDTVARVKDKTMMLKRPLEDVKSTLDSLKPLIEEIAAYNKVLNLPKEELEKVRFQMEEGVELLHKCSKVRQWTSYNRYEYANKLLGLDESLQGLLNILRVQLARDVRERLVSVSKIEKLIDQIEESGTVQLQNHPTEIEDSCDVLEPPQPEVGLSVQGTRDVKETLDSAAKIEVGVKRIEGSGDVQGQTDMGIGEPKLPTLEAPDVENEVIEYVSSTVTVGLDEDLICVSPAPSFTAMDDEPTAYFSDFSTSYLEDKISHVSEDANPMAHFHDSSASTARDRSSYVSRDVGTKFPLGNPVKSTQIYLHQKLELKVSADDKKMKKVTEAVCAIRGVSSISWDAKNQKLTVFGQLDPMVILTKLRKIVRKTEFISVAMEEIKEDKKERNLTMKEKMEDNKDCSIGYSLQHFAELISDQGTRHLRTDERN